MKRLALLAAGSLLATVPAAIGLTANPALSHRVPVSVPRGARPVQVADTQQETRHQGAGLRTTTPAPSSGRHLERGDDNRAGRVGTPAGEGKGGSSPHVEPGEDGGGGDVSGGVGDSGSSGRGDSGSSGPDDGTSGGADDSTGHS